MTTTAIELASQDVVARVIAKAGELPVLPETAIKVMHELRTPGITVPRLIRLVELDPAMTVAVLRTANSAFYGSQAQLRDLKGAINSIGMKQTRNLLYALVLKAQVADAEAYGSLGVEVFEHSLAVAFGSRLVADTAGVDVEDVFLCGILHDIGKLALAQALRLDSEGQHRELQAPDLSLIADHHAETGALLATKWGLPADVANVIRYHHTFESADAPQPSTACVALANALCNELGLGGPAVVRGTFETASAAYVLKLTAEQLGTIRAKLPAVVQPATAAFRS